jgi:hypothetical protein
MIVKPDGIRGLTSAGSIAGSATVRFEDDLSGPGGIGTLANRRKTLNRIPFAAAEYSFWSNGYAPKFPWETKIAKKP